MNSPDFYKRREGRFWWTRDPATGRPVSTRFTDLEAAKIWLARRQALTAEFSEEFIKPWNEFAGFDAAGRTDAGTVYFVLDASRGAIKIGFTKRTADRLYKLRMGNPAPLAYELMLPGTPRMERACHELFAPLRIRGEWFRREGELARFIDRAITKASSAS